MTTGGVQSGRGRVTIPGLARAALPQQAPTLTLLPPYATAVKAALTRLRTTAWRVRHRSTAGGAVLRVLHYHRISDAPDSLAVSPARFAQQMHHLAENGWTVLDLVGATEQLQAGTLPDRAVALTFDDGYRDVVDNALPVLEAHGATATAFVVTGAADGTCTFPWYQEQPEMIAWADIVALDRCSGLRFEAHSLTHPDLRSLSDQAARAEIVGSKTELEQRLGRAVSAFCYPVGLYGDRERRLVREAGFRVAVSCEPGVNEPSSDLYALRRTQVEHHDSLADFAARLQGAHDQPLPLRRAVRRWRYG